jgi:hypothetical protein
VELIPEGWSIESVPRSDVHCPDDFSSSSSDCIISFHAHRPSKITPCTPSMELAPFLLPPLVPLPRIWFLVLTRNCRFQWWHPNHGRNWSQ